MSIELALRPPPALPEWRRSGPFLLLAVALHAALLAAPLRRALGELASQPLPLSVTLVKPPEPLPVAAPKPKTEPLRPAATPTAPARERPQARPTPVLAMTPEQQPVAAASATVAPPAPPAPAIDSTPKPAPAAPAAAASSGPAVSAVRFDASYLQNPKPNYPALSRRLGEEGKVLLKVRVGPDGKPLAVDLEKGSGFERLDNAARQVVQNWRFVPAKRGDEAVEASVIVPIVFRLDS